jgi:polysaccharide export outer membrane protein
VTAANQPSPSGARHPRPKRNESIKSMNLSARKLGSLVLVTVLIPGCGTFGASGPAAHTVLAAGQQQVDHADIKIIDVDAVVAQRLLAASRRPSFSETFGDGYPATNVIGKGDALEVTIWEAPPAVLFGTIIPDARAATLPLGRNVDLPAQVVDSNGQITVPFAGSIPAAGRTPQEIQREIVARLTGKAHSPQAIVRLARNATSNVNVIGEVVTGGRMPLSARGERLLDVLAAAGGVKQPVGKVSIQLTRDGRVLSLPMEQIIGDSSQNIILRPNDVVTALYQPYSFTALGAIKNNAEVPFEATGLTLSQALGRIGGLDDNRANIRGAFIFRFEDPRALPEDIRATAKVASNGRVPVIYRIDLRNPATFFAAERFPVRDKDIIYVSSAPGADFQKFLNIVSAVAFSVVGITQQL